jgi:uncharacterized protein YegL
MIKDGKNKDDFKGGLDELMSTPWGKKAVRIAIAIGKDVDLNVLEQFAGNNELVLEAKNPQLLTKFIKWASTVVKNVSAPRTGDNLSGLDVNTIPTAMADDDDDIW